MLDKIMYGFKEAAYWWNVTLTKVVLENGYKQMSKDKCVFVKSESNHTSCCAITVDCWTFRIADIYVLV